MSKLNESQLESLKNAVSRYHASLAGSPAEEYLAQRSLEPERVSQFRFGYVEDPLPEHEKHRGKLAIPYLRKHPRYGWMCVSIRFRDLEGNKPKYATLSGDRPRLFNTLALTEPGFSVGVSEGELDAVSATLAGLPTVGVPGATSWQDHWCEMFRGYKNVFVFTDGDAPGEKLGRTIAKGLDNARIIHMPDGEDVNSVYQSQGEEALQRLWKEY